jgi:pimeloyl-ACP methyl ester carboxylesterase
MQMGQKVQVHHRSVIPKSYFANTPGAVDMAPMLIKRNSSDRVLATTARIALAAATAPLLCSCTLINLKHQVNALEQQGTIGVVLSTSPDRSSPTYAFAWTRTQNGALASVGLQTVGEVGLASFNLLANHVYGVAAFTDENQSGQYEAGEPLAFRENVRPSQFTDLSAPLQVVTLSLRRSHQQLPGAIVNRPPENRALGTALRAALGELRSVNDPRFSKACGRDGMWRPSDFLDENTLGIYFTEPYDPNRTPVLFVHGIGGTPQDFSYMMANFDHTRYQLWFFHYPSGMRLGRLSSALAKGLEILQQRHGFSECFIVAHSMGGLVSASAIREEARALETNFITRFVTISTPFEGHAAARLAVRCLSKPVPSWIDVAPQSAFLQELARSPLPHDTRYDLIYGDLGSDDGVVSVASELEPHNVKKASSVSSFPFDHEQILNEPTVVKHVLKCLQADKAKPQTIIAMHDPYAWH